MQLNNYEVHMQFGNISIPFIRNTFINAEG